MGKKSLIILLFILIAIGFLYLNTQSQNENQQDIWALEQLKSLPYLTHTAEKVNETQLGIAVYNKDLAFDGYNLYSNILMDMDGNIIKSWPNLGIIALLENEYLLGYDNTKIGLYHWDSTPLWQHNIGVHHDAVRTDKGTFLVLNREAHEYNNRDVEFDIIIEFSADGKEIYRWSTYEQFDYIKKKCNWTSPLDKPSNINDPPCDPSSFGGCYGYFHINSIQTLPETPLGKIDKRFQKGNWLISMLGFNTVVILDVETKNIVWHWGAGEIEGQHMPQMLENGHILIYDNCGLAFNNAKIINASRIIELDPLKKEIVWEYLADPPQSFYSANMGSAQRLPNGNTLILESNTGRAFEVTEEGKIVWEWFNPEINEEGKRETIYRLIRIPKDKLKIDTTSNR